MDNLIARVGVYLAAPEKIIFAVATALLYPVLFIEVGALLYVAFDCGTLTREMFIRRRARKGLDVEAIASEMAAARAENSDAKMTAALDKLEFGPVIGPAARKLSAHGMTRVRAIKVLADAEQTAIRRLDKTRVLIRIGPMLGLMGTLIPISPALVGLAQGDTQTLSTNLVTAFSTTVVGLLIGATAYIVALIRERAYSQDLADLEYVLEHSGAK